MKKHAYLVIAYENNLVFKLLIKLLVDKFQLFFARKFNNNIDDKIIKKIYKFLMNEELK